MGAEIVEIFESFGRDSIVLIINSCLNVCKEISTFFLILIMLYYFAQWSFRFLDEFLLATPAPGQSDFIANASEALPVVSEAFLRIGAPDEKLIKQRASLLEQLEFEENIRLHIRSENNLNDPEIHSNEVPSLKELFISQKKYEQNETSRYTQTNKTTLGKKSKPRQRENFEGSPQANSTWTDQPENSDLWQNIKAKKESDTDAIPTTSAGYEMPALSDDEQKHT